MKHFREYLEDRDDEYGKEPSFTMGEFKKWLAKQKKEEKSNLMEQNNNDKDKKKKPK